MKLLKNYFIDGLGQAEALAEITHRAGKTTLEATYRGEAEAYRLCLNYYKSIDEDIQKFIEDMEPIMEFYKKIYMIEEDSTCYHKRYYSGLYFELRLIMEDLK